MLSPAPRGRAVFISDLHLCEERPELHDEFARLLTDLLGRAGKLFILGDLFEAWIGDDQLDHDPLARDVALRLSALTKGGMQVYFLHGNRDFLIGDRFASEAGCALLNETERIDLDGEATLLLHGDTLCTDDVDYQRFRSQVRNPGWQREFLSKPYAEREAIARSLRSRSDIEKSMKPEAIMDVNAAAVDAAFARHGVTRLIHGHTHRPATHRHGNAGQWTRMVLEAWPCTLPVVSGQLAPSDAISQSP